MEKIKKKKMMNVKTERFMYARKQNEMMRGRMIETRLKQRTTTSGATVALINGDANNL